MTTNIAWNAMSISFLSIVGDKPFLALIRKKDGTFRWLRGKALDQRTETVVDRSQDGNMTVWDYDKDAPRIIKFTSLHELRVGENWYRVTPNYNISRYDYPDAPGLPVVGGFTFIPVDTNKHVGACFGLTEERERELDNHVKAAFVNADAIDYDSTAAALRHAQNGQEQAYLLMICGMQMGIIGALNERTRNIWSRLAEFLSR